MAVLPPHDRTLAANLAPLRHPGTLSSYPHQERNSKYIRRLQGDQARH
jgi:hypothetical protein